MSREREITNYQSDEKSGAFPPDKKTPPTNKKKTKTLAPRKQHVGETQNSFKFPRGDAARKHFFR